MINDVANPFIEALAAEAKAAGLRYVSDGRPGIHRRRGGKSFRYVSPGGKGVDDPGTLARIKRLAIPPAWQEVWISPAADGHIQATGRDARGRKQYRYHPDWRVQRDENKYARMLEFARALPKIRRRVKRDLQRRGLPREKVLAAVVRLLEVTLIRVGNDEYARENSSYGLTTMRNRHARIQGGKIQFSFRGKSGKSHEISLQDAQLARIVRRCQELPGQELFSYEGEDGGPHNVSSQDVNDYLREIAGDSFSAKDFRTWAGTVLAAIALREFAAAAHETEAKRNIVTAIESVARLLGNTPAVCRKCYVHPAILDSYLAGQTIATIQQRATTRLQRSLARLRPEEAAVLMLLHQALPKRGRGGRKKVAG